jgi:glucose-6-phosphate isomerase
MDQHFRTARWRENLPVLMAALQAWNVNFLGFSAHAVLPYSDRLSLLPAHLQQLEMESNGKSVTSDGAAVGVETAPVIWGAAANDAQHSFFQLLHQGSNVSSMDIILPMSPPEGSVDYDWVLANAVAQIEAFTMGFDNGEPHKRHEGNRSLSLILLDRLSPERLGGLLALYEHKVFVLSRIWQTNPFDQFGVELGKVIARQVVQLLGPTSTPEALTSSDLKSVRALILQLRAAKGFDR